MPQIKQTSGRGRERVNFTIPAEVLGDLDELAEADVCGNRSLMIQLLVRKEKERRNKSRKKSEQPA